VVRHGARWVRFAEIGSAWCAVGSICENWEFVVRYGAPWCAGEAGVGSGGVELVRVDFSKPAIDNKDGDASKRAEFMDGMDTVGSACRRSSP